jgi:glycosyltransferase involved in cell wall biosynthesis
MKKPDVSIVVTCYNYEKYVEACLNSIKDQTCSNYEVIIVNDGSTDNSEDVILKYLNDKRFKYVRQDNAGQTKAKNRGIEEATSDLIAFLDADDIWSRDKLEKQLPLFKDVSVGVVYSNSIFIDNDGNILNNQVKTKDIKPRRGDVTRHLLIDNFVPFSSSIVRRVCLKEFGGFNESLSMGIDWDLWLRISTRYRFDYCDKGLLFYRVGHSGQMSKNLQKRVECSDIILKDFINKYSYSLKDIDIDGVLYRSYCKRAYTLRKINIREALKYYLKGIQVRPYKTNAYKGLVLTLISKIIRLH